MGGNCLLKLNIDLRPIANKYREGKMKRTLERELKVPEIAVREANGTSFVAEIVYWLCESGHRKGRSDLGCSGSVASLLEASTCWVFEKQLQTGVVGCCGGC